MPYTSTTGCGAGCIVVLPVAFLGTSMIVEYPGPPGPLGMFEFVGWWSVCIATGLASACLFGRWREGGQLRLPWLAGGLAIPVALAILGYLDVRPDTPARVKATVEYGLQIVGLLAVGLLAIAILRFRRGTRRS